MHTQSSLAALAAVLFSGAKAVRAAGGIPVDTIYGVNLGSWLLLEPYMLPNEWSSMGGDPPSTCSCGAGGCAGSEWDLVNRIGQDAANTAFATHWSTWFTQDDANAIAALGLNTVRIPLGFWIVDEAKDATTDLFPEGGFGYLTQGLGWLADAGIHVLLDIHGVPDQQVANNADTGRCQPSPSFFQNANSNFDRAALAATNLTKSAHTINEWRTVFAIEAINEPPQNVGSDPTPNYGTYMTQFTNAVRQAETDVGATSPLSLVFMDYNWQYGGTHDNPADSAQGNAFYDNHLYYSFGGVASAATQDAYMQSICNIGQSRVSQDASSNNSPLVFGEWWLATEDGVNPDDAFYKNWSDAQRLAYSSLGGGAGWIFWAWKFEGTDSTQDYQDAHAAGYFPDNASDFFNANVCAQYVS